MNLIKLEENSNVLKTISVFELDELFNVQSLRIPAKEHILTYLI